jgi:hypothetical protein
MNQGIFAFPNINDPNLIDIKEFDVSGSYSIPDGTKLIQVIAIGAGGGGGSGRRRATTAQTCSGGGGGGSGSSIVHTFLREQLDGKVLEISIGAGGNGGASRTTDNTNGAAGSVGGATTLRVSGKVGFLLYATGGGNGGGGTTGTGISGVGRSPMFNGFISNNSGSGGVGSTITSNIISYSFFWQKGGAGGSGFSILGISALGGGIALASGLVVYNTDYALGATLRTGNSSNAAQSTDLDGTGIFVFGKYTGGIGGAGGGAGTTQAATNGGSGWRGGGGGGGGASFSGFNSGAGGRGGNGYVSIFCYK